MQVVGRKQFALLIERATISSPEIKVECQRQEEKEKKKES